MFRLGSDTSAGLDWKGPSTSLDGNGEERKSHVYASPSVVDIVRAKNLRSLNWERECNEALVAYPN